MDKLDSAREVATPEGSVLTLRLAGPVARAVAALIDGAIRIGILILLGIAGGLLGALGYAFWIIAAFVLEWFYPILFEVFRGGATPGKRAMRLVVLREDGAPVDWGSSFSRNILRVLDFLPFGYGVGLLTMLLGTGFHRLGDLVAGTIVVYEEDALASVEIGRTDAAYPTRVTLRLDEQRALIDFVRRTRGLTDARAEELACLAEPLVADLAPDQARIRLLGIGRYLMGHRSA